MNRFHPTAAWQVFLHRVLQQTRAKAVLPFVLALAMSTLVSCAPAQTTGAGDGSLPSASHSMPASTPPQSESSAQPLPIQPDASAAPDPTASAPAGSPAQPGPDSTFQIDFIDVGQADAALVRCDGQTMLIDGGNVADSNLIYSYLQSRSIDHLDVVVNTHAHEDHVGGLSGALNYATVGTAYCPVTEYSSKAFQNFVKYLDQQSVPITVPSPGDTFSLGSAQVQILGPISPSDEPNNTSIVLRIVYGNTSYLFTGDAQREEEAELLDAGYDLKSDVLKVGHHGSDTSTSYPFLREIMPEYAVISVGTGNSYGHPTQDVLSRLRDADVTLYRTDLQGDIILTSDGTTITFTTQREAQTPVNPTASSGSSSGQPQTPAQTPQEPASTPPAAQYVGNAGTKKFHRPTCSSVDQIKEGNQVTFDSREEAVSQGYDPCKRCNP